MDNISNKQYLHINGQSLEMFKRGDEPLRLPNNLFQTDSISSVMTSTLKVGSAFRDVGLPKQAKQNVLDAYQHEHTEQERIKLDLNELNTTLRILIHQQHNLSAARDALAQVIENEILPILNQLKNTSSDFKQLTLLRVLEANVQNLLSSYGDNKQFVQLFQKLTPKEIQIASMVRQGLATKHIATTLSTSVQTINAHRKHIRKKLGLDSKAISLRRHLCTFNCSN